jgi:hypothetical protein
MFQIPINSYVTLKVTVNGKLLLPEPYDVHDEPLLILAGCRLHPFVTSKPYKENNHELNQVQVEIKLLNYEEAMKCPYTIRKSQIMPLKQYLEEKNIVS